MAFGIGNDYSYSSYVNNSNSIFDYDAATKKAQEQADKFLDGIGSSSTSSKTGSTQSMKNDTSKFLNDYTKQMKELDKSTQVLRNGGVDKLLYDDDGNITEDTVNDTISAVEDMVKAYNDTVAFLGKNSDRGPGVERQLARMVRNPISKEAMAMVGLSMNKDGTLSLDKEKLTAALNEDSPLQLDMFKDILGGFGGIADSVHRSAVSGVGISASSLVQNDIANIQSQNSEKNPFKEMYSSIKGNVYLLNNMAAAGMFMNMFA